MEKRSGVMGRRENNGKLEREIEHYILRSRVRDFYILDRNLFYQRVSWKNYLFQSLLAMITMFFVLIIVNVTTGGIIIAVIGSTAFIVFAMPTKITAHTRNIVGGHMVGALSGLVAFLIADVMQQVYPPTTAYSINVFSASLAVGLSTLLMVVTDTEHPPAGGTAIWVAVYGWKNAEILFIIGVACLLATARILLRKHLVDLV